VMWKIGRASNSWPHAWLAKSLPTEPPRLALYFLSFYLQAVHLLRSLCLFQNRPPNHLPHRQSWRNRSTFRRTRPSIVFGDCKVNLCLCPSMSYMLTLLIIQREGLWFTWYATDVPFRWCIFTVEVRGTWSMWLPYFYWVYVSVKN